MVVSGIALAGPIENDKWIKDIPIGNWWGGGTPGLFILVTINAMDIAWDYGVEGAPMEQLILNAQYMWTHPPLV